MDEAPLMCVLHGVANFRHEVEALLRIQPAAFGVLRPRLRHLPVALRMNLLLPPSEHVLRRDISCGAVPPAVLFPGLAAVWISASRVVHNIFRTLPRYSFPTRQNANWRTLLKRCPQTRASSGPRPG